MRREATTVFSAILVTVVLSGCGVSEANIRDAEKLKEICEGAGGSFYKNVGWPGYGCNLNTEREGRS